MNLTNYLSELIDQMSVRYRSSRYRSSLLTDLLIFIVRNYLSRKGAILTPLERKFINYTEDDVSIDQDTRDDINISYRKEFTTLSFEELRVVCEHLIDAILFTNRRGLSLQTRSNGIGKLLVDLARPRGGQLIYDPACGTGNNFIEFNNRGLSNLRFLGNEIDRQMHQICMINLITNDIADADIRLGDSLVSPPFEYRGNIDLCVAVLPVNSAVHNDRQIMMRSEDGLRIPSLDFAFIELILSLLNETGRAVVVVPESFLTVKSGRLLREKYLLRGWIESITGLPRDIFQPAAHVKTSIIVFNKASVSPTVLFEERDSSFRLTGSRDVPREDILITRANLNANRYTHKNFEKIRNILAHSLYPVVRVGDLVSTAELGIHYPPYVQTPEKTEDTLPYVRIADLAKDSNDFLLHPRAVERQIHHKDAKKVVNYPAVLISLIGGKLKPTYFKYTGHPIVIGSDILAMRIIERFEETMIEPFYFLTQLHSQLVQIQVEMLITGNVIARLKKDDFLDIEVVLPPLEEQERQILEISAVISEKERSNREAVQQLETIQQVEYDVIATISHNLNQKFGSIIEDYDTLIRFLKRKERNRQLIDSSEHLRPISHLDRTEDIDTLGILVARLQSNLLDTTKTLKTTEDILQKNRVHLENVDLIKFFKNEIQGIFGAANFEIEVRSKLRSLVTPLDRYAFKDAIRNLIENAKKHGFVNTDHQYLVIFEISKYTDVSGAEYARILYTNNGKSFPTGFSFEEYKRLGGRAGKTKGTGLGGFFINKVVDLHQGQFNLVESNGESSITPKVEFEILLPLENSGNRHEKI